MTMLELNNIQKIGTANKNYENVTDVLEVYSNGIAFFDIIYENGKRAAVRVDMVTDVEYK